MKLKISLGQILLEGGEPDRNFQRIIESANFANENGAKILLLPECSDIAWTHPSYSSKSQPIPGKYTDILSEIAKKNDLYICCGLTEKSNDNFFNSAVLLDNNGKLIHKYRKINVLSKGKIYSVGKSLSVVETDIGNIGINICSDNYANSICISETLCRMGAEIILSPSSWTVDYSDNSKDPYGIKWKAPINFISKKYSMIFATVTSVGYIVGGPFEGRKMVGCSFISQNGNVIVQGIRNEVAGENILSEVEIHKNNLLGTDLSEKVESLHLDQSSIDEIEKDLIEG